MKKIYTVYFILFLSAISLFAQGKENTKTLLIRCDDIGMSHAVNMAALKLIDSGIPFSASVMFACPWYQEAVDILKLHPEIAAGIHLTLNAEWKNYRWGPVSGKDAVPSLVDSCGYFFPSRAKFNENNPKLNEIEKELRAQIERGIHSGLKISYVDYHMGTAVDKPEYRAILEKLAKEYGLGISRYFGEKDTKIMYSDPVETKLDSLITILNNLETDKINLLVCHIGLDQPELQAMIDMNSFGLKEMSKHRQAELNALLSERFSDFIKKNNIRLITYEGLR
ncbi:MAG: ChbG/HpnK family deacetylase [Bacillota bacterium]